MGEVRGTSPDTISRLQAGVQLEFTMLAGMQMEVFTLLVDSPRITSKLAEALGVAEERLSRLLHALVVSGLLEKRQGGFANTKEAAEFLAKGRSGYLGGIVELLNQLRHADLSAFVQVLSPDDARVLSPTTVSCGELQRVTLPNSGGIIRATKSQ